MKNDYVFHRTETGLVFVGDFDGLYSEQLNPWGQNGREERLKEYYKQSRDFLKSTIIRYPGKVAEIGCGLGYALDHITEHGKRDAIGYDVSNIAIKSAKKQFPHLKFKQADITTTVVKSDIIILNEMLWYVLKYLDIALKNCNCKYLIINQSFLKKQ